MGSFELATEWSAVSGLRADWERLWQADPDACVSQSFQWSALRWTLIEREPRSQPCVVVQRDGERVTLLWPFLIQREGVWRIARPLDQVTTEYSALLAEQDGDRARIAEAWRFARANVPCDLFIFRAMPAMSALESVLREEARATVRVMPRLMVRFDGFPTWDAYYVSVKNDKRRGLQRRIRRLEEAGAVTIVRPRDAEERAQAIEWLFNTKSKWLDEQGEVAVWRNIRGYGRFLAALPADDGESGGLSITLLQFDGKTIAGEIARVDRSRIEPFVSTFDPEFAKYSPGEILCMHCIKHAQARGLVYDFRIGDDPYKSYWANARGELRSYKIARTLMGVAGNALVEARQALRRRMNMKAAATS
jgi:CelD/BcsL family acetyltransferase involved in cellulose biosynthesis